VPTMGALHEGHAALVRAAREECGFVVVSIFVNPTQFGPAEDFARYPRDEAGDLALVESLGADAVFLPSVEEVYPGGGTAVRAGKAAERWEGERRPGHFDGVATVVAALFHMVGPCTAYFGLKDLQQCAVVSSLVRDLHMPVRLRWLETVREPSGLAFSSRNRYLAEGDRAEAAALYECLLAAAARARAGDPLGVVVAESEAWLRSRGFAVEYLALVEPSSMEPLNALTLTARWVVAATFRGVRLIDNVPVHTS
jgi:pantoate--beta-alanine ligase